MTASHRIVILTQIMKGDQGKYELRSPIIITVYSYSFQCFPHYICIKSPNHNGEEIAQIHAHACINVFVKGKFQYD